MGFPSASTTRPATKELAFPVGVPPLLFDFPHAGITTAITRNANAFTLHDVAPRKKVPIANLFL